MSLTAKDSGNESSPPRSNYTRQTSRIYNSSTRLNNFIKPRGEGYPNPRVSPHRSTYDGDDNDNDNKSLSLVDGYLSNRLRRLSSTRLAHKEKFFYIYIQLSNYLLNGIKCYHMLYDDTPPSQMLTDDDEPLPTSLRSSEHYISPYHTTRSDFSTGSGAPSSVYYTPADDIPSPSPSGSYGHHLSSGYRWRTSSVTVGYTVIILARIVEHLIMKVIMQQR
uniref:Uncharacterized protein n=1 Tax=Wuchereria bancrofti TaxID=6293 RepID=A0A1I8EKN9_WUCBA